MTNWPKILLSFVILIVIALCALVFNDAKNKIAAAAEKRKQPAIEYELKLQSACSDRWPLGGERLNRCLAGADSYSTQMYREDM